MGCQGGGQFISLTWPQAAAGKGEVKRRGKPLWEGVHKTSKQRMYIATKQDHYLLMVLYENGRNSLSQRIDACGAIAD
jgi:hypothetical protein